jgi:cell division protein FtsB
MADRMARLNSVILKKNAQIKELSRRCTEQTKEITELKDQLKKAKTTIRPTRKSKTKKSRTTETTNVDTK